MTNEIDIVDPREWVRRNPGMFFRGARPDGLQLATWVLADVIETGGGGCRLERTAGWWLLGSDVDWLLSPGLAVRELFTRVVAEPKRGTHSMRAEILLEVFCADVFTKSQSTEELVKGVSPELDLLERIFADQWTQRLVAFRLGADLKVP